MLTTKSDDHLVSSTTKQSWNSHETNSHRSRALIILLGTYDINFTTNNVHVEMTSDEFVT